MLSSLIVYSCHSNVATQSKLLKLHSVCNWAVEFLIPEQFAEVQNKNVHDLKHQQCTDDRRIFKCHRYTNCISTVHVYTHICTWLWWTGLQHPSLAHWLIQTPDKRPQIYPLFFLINRILVGHSVRDLTCKIEIWVIFQPFVGDNSKVECHQSLNSPPREMCQSGTERHCARKWITARGDVKGTFCAFLQHKHLSPSSPHSSLSALSLQTTVISASQVVEDDSEISMFRVGSGGMELVKGENRPITAL